MLFEYDTFKNDSNIKKHKISFEEAQKVWDDPNLIVLPARKRGEKRKLAIGRYCAMLFSVVHTERGAVVRIISGRRATPKEAKYYDQHKEK